MILKIKYFDHDGYRVPEIKVGENGNWIDLYTAEDVRIWEGTYMAIPLGIGMKLHEGYEALIAPRSSTFKHWGIIQANSLGIIDESYSGDDDEWHFLAYCAHGGDFDGFDRYTLIPKGTRICQFRVLKSMDRNFLKLETVDRLDEKSRGGIGSTGK